MTKTKDKQFVDLISQLSDETFATIMKRREGRKRYVCFTDNGHVPAGMHADLVQDLGMEVREFIAAKGQSKHLPDITEREEELADIVICCLTYARARKYEKFGETILRKIEYNKTRED